jgi:glutamate formiminotransferase/formiminotetrahydrofolate cyclodeaminase
LPLVECVPNFSEGRRQEVVQAIVRAISSAPVRLLDYSSDIDHNRTVVTFVGTPEAVERAAYAGIKAAATLIDMDVHKGQHPRLGATDVVPFIPIRDVTMEECIGIAKRLGQRVAEDLSIPVYLYEAAATRPDRENLENVRRGEYEALKTAIKTDPNRKPDYGPLEVGKAGATIIGARPPLIAFNAYLTTGNVEIARKIARAIRHSSGGLRFVKALGLLVEGKAQVSMNLTNFEKTPIYRAVEMIRREAERYGVGIAYTELIGLIPENALVDSAQWYLQLDGFQPDQILERKLQNAAESAAPSSLPGGPQSIPEPPLPDGATIVSHATTPTVVAGGIARQVKQAAASASEGAAQPAQSITPAEFIDELAQGTPVPGGGAVAALAGALAAALAEMVARLTVGKKKYAEVEPEMQKAASAAESLRRKLLDAMERDSRAYGEVMDAYKLDKANPAREGAIQAALFGAANVPLEVMRYGQEALQIAKTVVGKGNTNAVTDGAVGVHMAMAAIEGAALNVRVNAHSITDRDAAAHFRSVAGSLLDNTRSLSAEILTLAENRAGLK